MFVVIFGCFGCFYCVCVKEYVEILKVKCDDFNYCYVDIYVEGIIKVDLEKIIGKLVEIVL